MEKKEFYRTTRFVAGYDPASSSAITKTYLSESNKWSLECTEIEAAIAPSLFYTFKFTPAGQTEESYSVGFDLSSGFGFVFNAGLKLELISIRSNFKN